MKQLIPLLFGLLALISNVNGQFNHLITTGPNYFTVGFNLVTSNYPPGTAYTITNTNPSEVHKVVQKAVTDIGNKGGGVVFFKAGLYVMKYKLFIYKSYIHLKGEGIDKTIFKLMDYAPSFIVDGNKKSGFFRSGYGVNHLIMTDFTLDGNKNYQYSDYDHSYGRYGIFTEASHHVWFNRIRVTSFQAYGFDPHGWKDGGQWAYYLTITDCISDNNGWDGFTLDQTYNIYVKNCVASNNGRHGYNIVTGARYVTVTNCSASYNGYNDPNGGSGCGFMAQNNQLKGTTDVTFTNNRAIKSKKAGYCLNDVPRVEAKSNYADSSCNCFSVVKGRYTTIEKNTCNTKVLVKYGTDSVVVFAPPPAYNSPYVYVYDNTFNKLTSCL